MDNLADLRKLDLPFDVDDVDPICHECIRKQLEKYDKFTTKDGESCSGKFKVFCKGIPLQLINPIERAQLTDEQIEMKEAVLNPVKFAKKYLFNEKKEPFIARDYQVPMLSCTSKRAVYRCSRRIGKTTAVVIRILHRIFTTKSLNVMVIGPQKKHAEDIFNRIREFIYNNPILSGAVAKDVSSPYFCLQLKNGSEVKGFAGGTKGKGDGTAIRGSDSDLILVEEADYVDNNAIQGAILPILYTNENVELIGFSTPTGFKKTFYSWCTGSPQYKEFHYDYTVLPKAVVDIIEQEKGSYTEDEWEHEMLANWGSSESGVYKPAYIDKALHNYRYRDCVPTGGWTYGMGVDWNEKHGAEIIVLGHNPFKKRFRVVDQYHVAGSEFTQLNSVAKVIEINKKWRPKFIYVDAGNGATNYELLLKNAELAATRQSDPTAAKMLQTLRKYDSGSSIETVDSTTHDKVKKPAKAFMVNAAVRLFENQRIEISSEDKILEAQFRNYIIERYTPNKNPVFGLEDPKVGDHRLDAFNLACVAFQLEFNELFRQVFSASAGAVPDPRRISPATQDGEAKIVERPAPRDLVVIKNKLEEQLFPMAAGNTKDPLQGIKTNRPGWDSDTEYIEIEKFLQRRYARNRFGRGGLSGRPKRSNI